MTKPKQRTGNRNKLNMAGPNKKNLKQPQVLLQLWIPTRHNSIDSLNECTNIAQNVLGLQHNLGHTQSPINLITHVDSRKNRSICYLIDEPTDTQNIGQRHGFYKRYLYMRTKLRKMVDSLYKPNRILSIL